MKGLREVTKFTLGSSSMSAGLVTDNSKVGCPDCDTVYLRLARKGEKPVLLCITPDEALTIRLLLGNVLL